MSSFADCLTVLLKSFGPSPNVSVVLFRNLLISSSGSLASVAIAVTILWLSNGKVIGTTIFAHSIGISIGRPVIILSSSAIAPTLYTISNPRNPDTELPIKPLMSIAILGSPNSIFVFINCSNSGDLLADSLKASYIFIMPKSGIGKFSLNFASISSPIACHSSRVRS